MKLNTHLKHLRADLHVVQTLPEYRAIAEHYGARRAERSRVPLINHIHEGIVVISALDGTLPDGRSFGDIAACAGYCLHPLFQNDQDLHTVGQRYLRNVPHPMAGPVMLTMEYRWRANAWLSDKVEKGAVSPQLVGGPDAGGLPEVRAMLIADKVQNYKDFLLHHKGTHARSDELDVYFRTWLEHLGVDMFMFHELWKLAAEVAAP
jgi:hypothetical protein